MISFATKRSTAGLFRFVALLAAVLSFGATTASVAADEPTLAGRWSASPLTAKWVVGEWGDACGPKPSGTGASGGQVTITEVGRELKISGGGRTYVTSQCWEQYPGIQRVSHSSSSRSWKTTCKTPPSDSRQAKITTTLTATDDTISFYEAAQYQFVIRGQNCTASVGRYRTYELIRRAGEPPPSEATPEPEPAKTGAPKEEDEDEPKGRCADPGPPAKLEVRPARKLLRAGERFSFRAVVVDSAGCPVRQQPKWSITAGGEHGELTEPGTIEVSEDAPEVEIELTASVGGKAVPVTVEVASKERYEALLQSGSFNAQGEVDEAATVKIASQSIGARSAVAEDRAGERKLVFLGVVGAVALLLGVVGFVVVRRTRRATPEEPAAGPMVEPPTETAPAPPPKPAEPKMICPVCGEHYPPGSKFCGKDGASLLPLN